MGRHAIAFNYALVDVTSIVLDGLSKVDTASVFGTLGMREKGPPVQRIGAGDVIQVSVFESSTGGLFQPEERGVRPGFYVTMPAQPVSHSGHIAVPYAGQVRAAGRTVHEIERAIEQNLSRRAIEPQVVVAVLENNSSAVTVVGEAVAGANRLKLTGAGDRVLDVISRAGGTRFPSFELFVTLHRRGQAVTVHFSRLLEDPKENIYVQPGDTIYVHRRQQKFIAVGAIGSAGQTSGVTGQFPFEQDRLSLSEALAKAGGLQDSRADPSQVFLYREEARGALEAMGIDVSKFPLDQVWLPTVYRVNFRDPSSFILANRFQMRHRDLIYVANADSTEIVKFLNYVRAVTSTVSGVAADTTLTGDAIAGRHVLGR